MKWALFFNALLVLGLIFLLIWICYLQCAGGGIPGCDNCTSIQVWLDSCLC